MLHRGPQSRTSSLHTADREIHRNLVIPEAPVGVAIFAHGGGSRAERTMPHAAVGRGIATLELDLVSCDDLQRGIGGGDARAECLADCLVDAIDWLQRDPDLGHLPLALVGTHDAAASALMAVARRPDAVTAVVCADGRLDRARDDLARIRVPMLFVMGSLDEASLGMFRQVATRFGVPPALTLVPGLRGVLDQAGGRDTAARISAQWLGQQLAGRRETTSRRGLGDPVC